ncbi:hypothetical protein [Rheinheimera sp.]|uniref:hypothetical protein n=1 Tax=Rheinheimera sp. TaxID=1869214 RepID=UPI0040478823
MKLTKKNASKALALLLVLAPGAVIAAGVASGSTAGSFDDIFDEVKGWIVGSPGKIIATLAFGAAMFNVVKQNFIAAVGAFVGALLMAFAGTIIDTIFSAGI